MNVPGKYNSIVCSIGYYLGLRVENFRQAQSAWFMNFLYKRQLFKYSHISNKLQYLRLQTMTTASYHSLLPLASKQNKAGRQRHTTDRWVDRKKEWDRRIDRWMTDKLGKGRRTKEGREENRGEKKRGREERIGEEKKEIRFG